MALVAVPAFAQTGADSSSWALYLGAGLAIGLAGLGAGVGMGSAIRGGLEGISRNPGVAGKIFTYLLVGVALIESIAIYGLVVSLILLFVK
ncbi:MAG: ATP synthase F0 subunit C [Mucispirillum sp.]|nr:ATP synthase F0 subunit C [Mucispirillum sp.]